MLNRTSCIVMVVVVVGSTLPRASLALTEGVAHNGLSSQAFRFNALTTNKSALQWLMDRPLDETLFAAGGGYMARQMRDPHARAMLAEVVKCALNSGTVVSYKDPERDIVWSAQGELGLCPAWPGKDPAQRQSCQELVSACVMARVNAMKRSIPISLRSDPGRVPVSSPLAALDTRIPVDTGFREGMPNLDPAEGPLIDGFAGPLCLKDHECNWKPAYVGTCTPGETVQLAIEDPASCKLPTLRACAGIHGCVKTLPKTYASYITEKQGACAPSVSAGSPLSFSCPVDAPVRGYYSVMVLPPLSPDHPLSTSISVTPTPTTSAAPAVARITGTGKYPASETDVFTFLEGAFYGNLFRPERLKWSCELNEAGRWSCSDGAVSAAEIESCSLDRGCSVPVPYKDVYACYSYVQQVEEENDGLDAALLNSRICDLPDEGAKCFPHPLRRCHYKNREVNSTKGAGCDWIGDDGAYGLCRGQDGDSAVYRNIMTTYLNEPDDLIEDVQLAARLRSTIPLVTRAPSGLPTVHPRCGCSSDAADGGFASALLAALAVLVARGRRRRGVEDRAPGSSFVPSRSLSR